MRHLWEFKYKKQELPMSNNNNQKSETVTEAANTGDGFWDNAWSKGKDIAEVAVGGAAGAGLAAGIGYAGKSLFSKAAKDTAEETVASATRGGGGFSPF